MAVGRLTYERTAAQPCFFLPLPFQTWHKNLFPLFLSLFHSALAFLSGSHSGAAASYTSRYSERASGEGSRAPPDFVRVSEPNFFHARTAKIFRFQNGNGGRESGREASLFLTRIPTEVADSDRILAWYFFMLFIRT